jgi:hypothetical protein
MDSTLERAKNYLAKRTAQLEELEGEDCADAAAGLNGEAAKLGRALWNRADAEELAGLLAGEMIAVAEKYMQKYEAYLSAKTLEGARRYEKWLSGGLLAKNSAAKLAMGQGAPDAWAFAPELRVVLVGLGEAVTDSEVLDFVRGAYKQGDSVPQWVAAWDQSKRDQEIDDAEDNRRAEARARAEGAEGASRA